LVFIFKVYEDKKINSTNNQIHPLEFFKLLKWIDGRNLLDVLMPYHLREIEEAFWSTTSECSPQYIRVLFGRGKKNGKTLIGVLVALWLCLVWKAAGNKGNQIFYIASDLGQAKDDLDLTKKMIRCNPVIFKEVIIKNNRIERKDLSGFIEILPAQDVEGLHGKTYLAAIFDEFHTQKDYRVLEALELDRTRPDSRQLFLSYASPYRHAGVPLVDMLKQHEDKTDPRLYIAWHAGSIEEANPSLNGPLGPTMEDILQAKRSLPSWIFRRLYLNLGGMPDSSCFDADSIEACIIKGRTVLPPTRRIEYSAFVDMSGGGPDDSTLGIAHKARDSTIILDLVMDQGPRQGTFDPNLAVGKFIDILKLYRISGVTGDRYAGEWPRKAFERYGISYTIIDKNKSELYAALEPLINSGNVELLDHPKLFAQVLGLVRKGERIDHTVGEHDDWANAASGAAYLALNQYSAPRIRLIEHGFVESPMYSKVGASKGWAHLERDDWDVD